MDPHTGQEERFIEGGDDSGKANKSYIGEKLRQKVAKPIQSRFKTFMAPSVSSTDLTDLEMSTTNSSLPISKSAVYEPVDQKLSPKETGLTEYSEHIPAKQFERRTRFIGIEFGKWRVFARHFFVFAALVICIYIPCWYLPAGFHVIEKNSSHPFMYDCYGSGNGWTFLAIDLIVARNFSFGTAKTLDLAWNWAVGRGVQGLLSLLAYRVFSDALLRMTELTPLSYELYASIALYSNRFEVMWYTMKGLGRFGGWRVKAIFSWLLLSIIYLLVFPSLLDATTGYDAAQVAKFTWPNGTVQSSEDIYGSAGFTMDDNSSIVTISEICVTYTYTPDQGVSNFSYTQPSWYNYTYKGRISRNGTNTTRPLHTISSFGCPDTQSSDNLSHTTFNVYNWTDPDLNKAWWSHFESDPWTSQSHYWKEWGFAPTNSDNFSCDTKNNVYQWGFSYEWLFITVIANSVFLVGLWILWLECDINSELCKKGRRLGIWRAIADLSEAMREDLGDEMCAYSNGELWTELNKMPPVKYYVTESEQGEPAHIGLSSRTSGKMRLRWGQKYGKKDR